MHLLSEIIVRDVISNVLSYFISVRELFQLPFRVIRPDAEQTKLIFSDQKFRSFFMSSIWSAPGSWFYFNSVLIWEITSKWILRCWTTELYLGPLCDFWSDRSNFGGTLGFVCNVVRIVSGANPNDRRKLDHSRGVCLDSVVLMVSITRKLRISYRNRKCRYHSESSQGRFGPSNRQTVGNPQNRTSNTRNKLLKDPNKNKLFKDLNNLFEIIIQNHLKTQSPKAVKHS